LGGNGVANSTVFGGIAGDTMAAWVPREGALVPPDATTLDAAIAALEAPFARPARNLSPLRDSLQEMMWDKAGILRDATGLADATSALDALEAELDASGVDGANRAFNLTWHDWLNLKSLLLVSRAIVVASQAREESRGAHWREDFPETRDERAGLAATSVRLDDGRVVLEWQPVAFTRLKPGESLLQAAAE
jgi:fumarate reductase flavoprotein subunit